MLKSIFKRLGYFKLVNYLRDRSVFFAQYYGYLGLARKTSKKSILVYTMGKVGSTTIKYSLKDQLNGSSIHHIHWLNRDNLKKDKRFTAGFYRRSKNKGTTVNVMPNYLIKGFYLSNKIRKKGVAEDEYKIVTLTRDPVARNVSAFFQNLPKYFCYDIKQRVDHLSEAEVVEELSTLFVNEYIVKNRINFLDSDPLTWFDEELKTVFGIDVYDAEFPKEKGYKIYRNANASALLIRLENLDECLTPAFEEYLGKHVEIRKLKNMSDQKEYSEVYKKFKKSIEIPQWYLDKQYSSKFANHFYTEDEISGFRERWERKKVFY